MSQPPNLYLDEKNFCLTRGNLLLDKRFNNVLHAHTVLITVKGGHHFTYRAYRQRRNTAIGGSDLGQ